MFEPERARYLLRAGEFGSRSGSVRSAGYRAALARRSDRGALLFGDFLLDKQEKVTCRGSTTHKLNFIYRQRARSALDSSSNDRAGRRTTTKAFAAQANAFCTTPAANIAAPTAGECDFAGVSRAPRIRSRMRVHATFWLPLPLVHIAVIFRAPSSSSTP